MQPTGVIVARFQTPQLQEEHRRLISYVSDEHEKVVILLGTTIVKGSLINPLDFPTREKMLKAAYPEITVIPLPDAKRDDWWSASLDQLLEKNFPGDHFILYGSRRDFLPRYSGKYSAEPIPQLSEQDGSGFDKDIYSNPLESADFRKGVIYAYYNTYPRINATVDIAILKNNASELLMGRRHAEGRFRLPGGFTDPEDHNYESAAERELLEECGPLKVSPMHYEKSFKMDDWRFRNERDKIITTLFSCNYLAGEAKGSDDLDEVHWIPFKEITALIHNNLIAEEHVKLLNHLLEKYLKV